MPLNGCIPHPSAADVFAKTIAGKRMLLTRWMVPPYDAATRRGAHHDEREVLFGPATTQAPGPPSPGHSCPALRHHHSQTIGQPE